MEITAELLRTLVATLGDVAPIAAVLLGAQFLVLRQRLPNPGRILVGFTLVILGLTLFLVGLQEALFPVGRAMADQLTDPSFIYGEDVTDAVAQHWSDYYWVYLFAFSIGFAAVLVEPAVIAVALKANEVSGGAISVLGLRLAIAIGVGIGITIGSLRIVTGGSLHYFIVGAYAVVILQTVWAPRRIIPIAYDSGGVSTSTVTVPLVAALGLGLASGIPGRSPLLDGFGLIAFAVLFPIIAVMAYAQLAEIWCRWLSRRGCQARRASRDHAD